MRVSYRPAGKRLCDLDNVLLRISAVDTEGVQLHQLTCIILVNTALLPFLLLLRLRIFAHLLDAHVHLGIGYALSSQSFTRLRRQLSAISDHLLQTLITGSITAGLLSIW